MSYLQETGRPPKTRRLIYQALLDSGGGLTVNAIAERIGKTPIVVREALHGLSEQNVVTTMKLGDDRLWVVYDSFEDSFEKMDDDELTKVEANVLYAHCAWTAEMRVLNAQMRRGRRIVQAIRRLKEKRKLAREGFD